MSDWVLCGERLPKDGVLVQTKIDDGRGVRNVQPLRRKGNLWFSGSMYVYGWFTVYDDDSIQWVAEHFAPKSETIPRPKFMPGDECWWVAAGCCKPKKAYAGAVVFVQLPVEGKEIFFYVDLGECGSFYFPSDQLYATEAEARKALEGM
ncbi:MAG: hypothetical protein ACPG4T_01540 [Nannocystaceae bacterium]